MVRKWMKGMSINDGKIDNSRAQQGEVARLDPLGNYFTHFFEEKNMIDIKPI